MDTIFWEQRALRIPEHEMVLEREALEVCKEYDGGGNPPRFRIVLKGPETTDACDNLQELARTVSGTKFPIAEFIRLYPGQAASMIATLEGLRRPVQDDDFFEFVEAGFNVGLSDIKPHLINDELRWFESPPIHRDGLHERRLSVPSLTIMDGRRIPPVARSGDASSKPEA